MKRLLALILFLPAIAISAQDKYYFPVSEEFNHIVQTPEDFLGYRIGDHHTRYDKVVEYMKYLSTVSDRVRFEEFGFSVERRAQIVLTITSPDNHSNLETIRLNHLKLSDPVKESEIDKNMPVIVQLGFNVHGNEASGGEASLLVAYYLAAANDIDSILENSVIHLEPVLNPDGRDRFVTWTNMNRSLNASPDGSDREHTEAWPGGRTNHYWFDLNRDWLPLTQQESRNRLKRFHSWRPNVITDHHEMGSNSTFFFEPTRPGSENPVVPVENYTHLNRLFATEYAKALDNINHYYDAGRSFDNSYPGYGSSYADVNGGLAILFEQASSRGLVQKTDLGYNMHFSLGIKNQLTSALTTVRTAIKNRILLNDYMFRFYSDAIKESKSDRYRAYLFGDINDRGRTADFLNLLAMHDIEVYDLKSKVAVDGRTFLPGSSFVVPTTQPQYRMVRTMFETNRTFSDSLFYDATAWAMVYSFGLPFTGLSKDLSDRGDNRGPIRFLEKPVWSVKSSDYGYVFDWSEYYSAQALTLLEERNIRVKAAWEPFGIEVNGEAVNLSRGSVFIPVQYQEVDSDTLFRIVKEVSEKSGIEIIPVESSKSIDGPWMGNTLFRSLKKPKILMLTGDGVSSSSAGTIWHLLDTRLNMTFTRINITRLGRLDLYNYNTLIMPSGSYLGFDKRINDKIIEWLKNGGRIIAIGGSMSWLRSNKIVTIETKSLEPSGERLDYNIARLESGKQTIGGIFCSADLDITHPLGFGYKERNITLYKNNRYFVKQVAGPTSNISIYNPESVISGFITRENEDMLSGCSSLLHFRHGNGSIILFVDDPVFRGCWRGTDKMLINAIFFGGNL